MQPNKERIEKFSNSLGMALYDKKIEMQGHKLLFFVDTDVVINIVLGFEAGFPEFAETFSKQSIVRSLFSIGYLGQFHLLRPHAFEFYEKLRGMRKYTDIDDREQFRNKAKDYIERTGISHTMQRLHSAIREDKFGSSKSKDVKTREFLDILQENSAEVFSCIEQINGTWSQRMRRLFDNGLLRLDYLGPEISELVTNHREILFKINEVVRKERPNYPLNSFQDASALAILYTYINDWELDKNKFVSRFYTETSSINEILDGNPEIQEILAYKRSFLDVDEYIDHSNNVHRDADYFIVRALFSELAPNKQVSSESLQPLDELYFKISNLLRDRDIDIEDAFITVKFEGKSLYELLESYEKSSIMEPLWINGGVPEILNELNELTNWTKIFDFARGSKTGIVLNAQIRDIRQKLETQVSQIGVWTKDFKNIDKARKSRLKFFHTIENPMRDLGLVRWNYDLTADDREQIGNVLRELGEDLNASMIVGVIASDMDAARKNMKKCLYITPILWALGRFKDIDSIISLCRYNGPNHFAASLSAMQFAARMRSGAASTELENRKTVNGVSIFFANLSEPEKSGILLSVGYIYYHAWRQAMTKARIADRLWNKQPAELQNWANKALELGEQAFQTYDSNTLSWAYAVNHCAYVATATDIDDNKKKEYLNILLRIKNNDEIWCARFDDTVGYYYLYRAEKKWYLSSEEEKQGLDLSEDIANARKNFDSSKDRDTGDTDLEEHINRLNILSDSIEDYNNQDTT